MTHAFSPLPKPRNIPDVEPDLRPLSFVLVARLWQLMTPYKTKRNALIAIVLIRALQLPALAWAIGATINGPIANRSSSATLLAAAFGVLCLSAFTQLTMAYRERLALELGESVVHDLRGKLFQHLQRMPTSYYVKTKTGLIINRMTGDCDAVRSGVQDVLFVSMVQIGQMAGAAIVMAYYDMVLFGIVLAMTPILWLIGQTMRNRLSETHRMTQESASQVTANIAESVAIIRVTQALVREDTNTAIFRQLSDDHATNSLNSSKLGGILMPLLEFTGQVSLALILATGAYRALLKNDPMPMGSLIQFWFLAGIYFSPIQILGSQYNAALIAMAGAERVFRFLDTNPEWEDVSNPIVISGRLSGRIVLQNVCFEYEPRRPVLHAVDFAVDEGEMIAIVGETGSGKSTLANLIARYYLPTSGKILFDNLDLRTISQHSLARIVSVVPQQNFLFTGTVLENICFGRTGSGKNEALAALKALDCEWILDDLPNGLETETGARGGKVSLGQRQLICFARALVANPTIMILDEATSAVDTLTELRIQASLSRLLANRTSIVIAHRLSTIRNASQIFVLDQGRIVERGDHTSLISQGGIYRTLHKQFTNHR